MPQPAITSTTQDFLDIYDITNNMVFMKDGSAAAIMLVSAMNFSLLAEEEQDAVIYAYAALLNSLNFQVQINIQSKTKDATAYLDLLKVREDEASSADKRKRIGRYREFVGQLIQERNVLDKKFYVIVPAAALELGIVAPQSLLPGTANFDISTIEKSTLLEKAAGILGPRIDHLVGQFNRIGLFGRPLTTQEIIQNFYSNYNPEAVEGQQITDSGDYTTPMVQASMFNASMQNRQQTIAQFTQQLAATGVEVPQGEMLPEENTPVTQELTMETPVEPVTSIETPAISYAQDQAPPETQAQPEALVQTPTQAVQQPQTTQQPQPAQYSLPPLAEIK
jgi:hypothetical protein